MGSGIAAERKSMVAPSLRELARKHNRRKRVAGSDLIATHKVKGAMAFLPDGKQIGRVDHFMVDKRTGQAIYALMNFGGFLGLGEELRPLPWSAVEYRPELGGYVVDAENDKFRGSPFIKAGVKPEWDSEYAEMLHEYWGVPY